ncbi:unnamed protein product, partial [Effrenium voratum]
MATALAVRPGQPAGKPKDDDARLRKELAALCVRGQRQQVLEVLSGDIVKVASSQLDATGASALHLAVLGGHLVFTQELIAASCDVNARDHQDKTPLHIASAEGYAELALELLVAGAGANDLDSMGQTPLHAASFTENLDLISVLLDHGVDPTLRDAHGRTAAFIAAEKGKISFLSLLLEKEPGLALIPNNEFWTPLHVAAWGMQSVKNFTRPLKFLESLKLLLTAKAEADAKDENCCTPMHRAAQAGNSDTLQALLQAGAQISMADECRIPRADPHRRFERLETRCFQLCWQPAASLVQPYALSRLESAWRWTPLHYASQLGHLEIARLLLDAGAEANPANPPCLTPLAVATMENQVKMVELLLKRQADPNARAKGLHSPLMMARKEPAKYADILALFEIGFAREGRFEAHVLATSHFQRFDNFKPVTFENMDRAAQSFALPGPFWQDKFWGFGATAPVENAEKVKELQNAFASEIRNAKTPTTSGYGTRSHQDRGVSKLLRAAHVSAEALRCLSHMGEEEINWKDGDGLTLLDYAAVSGMRSLCAALLWNPDFQHVEPSTANFTPLHWAASCGQAAVCHALLEHPRFLDMAGLDGCGRTALHIAAQSGHAEVCRVLLKHPRFIASRPRVKDALGDTPLHRAAAFGHAHVCEVLLDHPRQAGKLSTKDVQGRTPLERAIREGRLKASRFLNQLTRQQATRTAPDRQEVTFRALDNGDGIVSRQVQKVQRQLDMMDENGDGSISRAEFDKAIKQTALDLNGDGVVTAQEVQQAKDTFRALDTNGDGVVSRQEVQKVQKQLDMMDENGDGSVSRAEFGKAVKQQTALDLNGDGVVTAQEVQQAKDTFRALDTNGDGVVSRQEVQKVQKQLDRMDENGDGSVSRAEFDKAVKQQTALDLNGDGVVTAQEVQQA